MSRNEVSVVRKEPPFHAENCLSGLPATFKLVISGASFCNSIYVRCINPSKRVEPPERMTFEKRSRFTSSEHFLIEAKSILGRLSKWAYSGPAVAGFMSISAAINLSLLRVILRPSGSLTSLSSSFGCCLIFSNFLMSVA